MTDSAKSPLGELAAKTGIEFNHILNARRRTCKGLLDYRKHLEDSEPPPSVSVVLMGSWGRAEVTRGSDNDFVILDDSSPASNLNYFKQQVETILDQAPSTEGPFATPVRCEPLIDQIGLQEDSNHHLTRRMLFLLESVPVLNNDLYYSLRDRLLDRYLDESVKDKRPPRFLLNDVVRYWRTICVDFAGKEHKDGEKWGLRNAKLRTSRKLLFAGGLLPVLRCAGFPKAEMFDFLRTQFSMPPTDRVADAFLAYGMPDAGARALGAYDEFLGLVDNEEFRDGLKKLRRQDKDGSSQYRQARKVGQALQSGLLALLFESDSDLDELVREYAIF